MTTPMSLEEASALIGLVYESALEKNQWAGLMARIGTMCPGHVAAVTTFEDQNWRSSHVPTLPDGEHGAQIADLMDNVEADKTPQPTDINRLIFERQPLELGTLYQTRALLSEDEFRNSDVYQKTMKPIFAGHWSAVHYSISENRRAAIMVVENEAMEIEKDTARVAEILTLIGPHAVRAARFARAFDMARQAAETYSGFIDAVALPLLVLTADGKLQTANTLGQRLIDADYLFDVSSTGKVTLHDAADQRRFADAMAECLSQTTPRALQIRQQDEQASICICPFLPAMSFGSRIDQKVFADQNLVSVFVGARATGAISQRLLRDAFSLSEREAEVCSRLLDGQRPAHIASETGRAEKTVRNQIHALHDKIGVKSTQELSDALAVFRTVGAMFADEAPA